MYTYGWPAGGPSGASLIVRSQASTRHGPSRPDPPAERTASTLAGPRPDDGSVRSVPDRSGQGERVIAVPVGPGALGDEPVLAQLVVQPRDLELDADLGEHLHPGRELPVPV